MKFCILLLLGLAGCTPNPPDGAITCNPDGVACPDGYQCIQNTCWKDGHSPVGDLAIEDLPLGDMGSDDAGGDLGSDGGGDMTRQPNKHRGDACTAADLCDTGNCVDGFCCDTTCTEACKACSVAGLEGTCSIVGAGKSPVHGSCTVAAATTCGQDGFCDGAGACRKYPSGTQCTAPACNLATNAFTPASLCDGNGACIATTGYNCMPYLCKDATSCYATCANSTQCSGTNTCTNASCGLLDDSRPCTSSAQCKNGHCADGYCCNSACAGQCQSCDVPAKLGVCSAVTGTPHGAAKACTAAGTTCGGMCDGTNQNACIYPGAATICNKSCKSATTETDFGCTGAGACSAAGTDVACTNNLDCSGNACLTSCTVTSGQCQSGFSCSAMKCVPPESDCLDGIDNNGDGLADCADPSCNAQVQCVPAAPVGDELGVLGVASCPSNYTTLEHFNQALQVPTTCSGCTCGAVLTCKTDFYFSGTTASCAAANFVGSLTYGPGSPTAGSLCVSVAAPSPAAIETTLTTVGTSCSSSAASAKADGTSWSTSANFCAVTRSSQSCGASAVCVAKPPVGKTVCARIPSANATCPVGYTTGSSATWFGDNQFTDTRQCSCTCNASGACTTESQADFFQLTGTGCPNTAPNGGVSAPASCFPSTGMGLGGWPAGATINGISYDGEINGIGSASCTNTGTVNAGSAGAGPSGSTVCCQ